MSRHPEDICVTVHFHFNFSPWHFWSSQVHFIGFIGGGGVGMKFKFNNNNIVFWTGFQV